MLEGPLEALKLAHRGMTGIGPDATTHNLSVKTCVGGGGAVGVLAGAAPGRGVEGCGTRPCQHEVSAWTHLANGEGRREGK